MMSFICKCKVFLAIAVPFCCVYGDIPLEWNINNKVNVPYELEIDRRKIADIAGVAVDHSYKVTATANGKKTDLQTVLLPGQENNKVTLRFTVPEGTTSLSCTPVNKKGIIAEASSCGNLFAQALQTPENWKTRNGKLIIRKTDGGIFFEAVKSGENQVQYSVDVPEDLQGKPVRFSIQLKSLSKMVWRNYIYIRQLNKDGKLLNTCAVDPRKISHLRPADTMNTYLETGLIHPEAKKLLLTVILASAENRYDSFGMPLADKKAGLPKLLISSISMREAHILPFPKYRDKWFSDGISGKNGDCALALNGESCFSFVSGGQAVYAEGKQLTDEKELFYPAADGTVECYFNAKKWNSRSNILLEAANDVNYVGGRYLKKRGTIFQLSYLPKNKKITLLLKDGREKEFKKDVVHELSVNKWHHIAAQWSQKNGVKLFVDGKLIMEDKTFSYTPIDIRNAKLPNILTCHQFTVGTSMKSARYWPKWGKIKHPDFCGKVDLLRISSGERYSTNFTPARSFAVDSKTRALFDFNRSFNGKTFGNVGIIEGTSRDFEGRQDQKISFKGKTVQYTPAKVVAEADQDKVLNRLNYPVIPEKSDFLASYIEKSENFTLAPGKKHTITLDDNAVTDYISFTNTGKEKICYPILLRQGEIDPRSFGDIAESLELDKLPPRERAYKIFNFLLGASDYFINYQAEFFPNNKNPRPATSLALLMLNSYCGFECGPLNNLAALIFSCSGKLASSMTSGYGHTFEQVFYDGKNRLYDLSAQRFFPSFENEAAASLYEAELEAGIIARTGISADPFIRLSTRGHYVNNIDYMEKAGVIVNPGETYHVFFCNNGSFNELNIGKFDRKRAVNLKEYNKILGLKTKTPIVAVPRPFPHYGNSFITFDGKPAKFPQTFRRVKSGSFEYGVHTSYPLTEFVCSAELDDGSFAEIEFSADNGKSFKSIKKDSDGKYLLDYEIMGHHQPLFKIKADIKNVKRFFARSCMMTNPRVLTGKLKKGRNDLTFKAAKGNSCDIKIAYRQKSSPIRVSGTAAGGAVHGYEKLLCAIEPGKTVQLDVEGVSDAATAKSSPDLKAAVRNGKLSVTAASDIKHAFGEVVIIDGLRRKAITFIISKGAKILTANDAVLSNGAKLIKAGKSDIADTIMFDKLKSQAVFKVKIPAGKYQIWNLNRFESHAVATHGDAPLELNAPGCKSAFVHLRNSSSDLLKAEYGKAGKRSRFKWDFPYTTMTKAPYHRPAGLDLKDTGALEITQYRPLNGGIELAAILILPCDDEDFITEMIKVLCGLNYNKWYIAEKLNIHK